MSAIAYLRRAAGGLKMGLVVGLVVGSAASPLRADLRFPEAHAHAGEVRSGIPLTQRFVFVNDGPETVEITEVRPDCGCLVPRLATRVYRPGEGGALLLEVHTLSQSAGSHTWPVEVRYRCGDAVREKELRLTAHVVAEISVQPAGLIIVGDSAVGHDIVFTDTRARPLAVTAVRASAPHLTARLTGAGRDAQGHSTRTIHVSVADDFPEGRYEEFVIIYTNDPAYRDLRMPVTVIKRPRQRVAALPDQAALTGGPAAPLPSQLIRLRDRQDQPVRVERIVADHPAIATSWAAGPGTMATLRISVDHRRLERTPWESAVHVHLSGPVAQTLTIPVSVRGP
jgi:hypothetical protein